MLRGDRLRSLRQQRGFTHEELAELLGVSIRQISRYESGDTDPAGDIVARIAQVFSVSADYLLGTTDDSAPNFRVDNLTPHEVEVLRAMRQGRVIDAIKALVAETPEETVS